MALGGSHCGARFADSYLGEVAPVGVAACRTSDRARRRHESSHRREGCGRADVLRSCATVLAIAPGTAASPPARPQVISAIRAEFRFVLLHAGNLGFYGAWETLLAAARELETDGVGLVFVGDGAQRARLEAAATGSANVRFLPFFPANKIASVLACRRRLCRSPSSEAWKASSCPARCTGFLQPEEPVVAVAPKQTDAASLAARDGFGVAADPDNPAELVAMVRALLVDPARLAVDGSCRANCGNPICPSE